MPSKAFLTALFLLVSIMTVPTLSSQNMHAHPERGLNYLSLSHDYSILHTSNETLIRDFSRFHQDGIDVISLSLYWYRLEGNTQGSYDGLHPDGSPYGERFLNDVKRVITVANQNAIKVLVTFHTLWGVQDSVWCTPKYVRDPISNVSDGLAVVRSADMREAFVNMFNHTVQYLAETSGIWAYALLNEPWYWGRTSNEHDFVTDNGKTQKENFISLIEKLSSIVKKYDNHPTTVRFISSKYWNGSVFNLFERDWAWDATLLNSLDFIGFNVYPGGHGDFAALKILDTLRMNVEQAVGKNKKVWITEFGYPSDDDSEQQAAYKSYLNSFKDLSLDGLIAWYWRGDSPKQNPGLPGKGNNLCSDSLGTPRPAYNEFLML